MFLDRLWWRLRDLWQIKYPQCRRTLWWLTAWLVGGIIMAIVTLIIGDLTPGDINYHLIDHNLLNMTSLDASMGSFLWQRLLSLLVPVAVVLGAALISNLTAKLVFPIVFMHGYWLCISVWWTFLYFTINAVLLLAFYIVWLLLVTIILFGGCLWALQLAAQQRHCHRYDFNFWRSFLRGILVLVGIALILGFCEYLIFWLVLGKIVYKPV